MTTLFELIGRYRHGTHIAIVVAVVACVAGIPFLSKADAKPGCTRFVWISYGDLTKEKDGSLTARLFIHPSDEPPQTLDGGNGLNLNAFYVTGRPRSEAPRRCFRTPVQWKNGVPYVDINSGVFSRIELTVSGRCGNRRHKAQTVFYLFGKSGVETANSMPAIGHLDMGKPFIQLTPDPRHYWMQTGETYRFLYKKAGNGSRAVYILENQRHLETLDLDLTGEFVYKPPHDRNLDCAGQSALKEAVLLIKETTGKDQFASTFTLLLHRSRYGHHKLLPGIGLFFLTATVVALAVIQKRRRFPS